MNLRKAFKYTAGLGLIGVLCLVPFGQEPVLAPKNELPTYLIAGDEQAETTGVNPKTNSQLTTVSRVTSSKERIRFLLLGTDEREDEASRSDTIILATYFPNEGKINLLSIPRDTKVWIPGQAKPDKINAAHAIGGMELTKDTIESWSGLSIDHVAKVNFNGFQELVDGVGGVTVSPERAFSYGGDSFIDGNQTIDGEEALNYVRFRKDQDGDFGRIKRQQEVVENTLKAVLSDFSLASLPSYFGFYKEHVKTDMSIFEMTDVAQKAYANGVEIDGMTLPTGSTKVDGIWFEETSAPAVESSLAWLEDQPEEPIRKPVTQVSNPHNDMAPRVMGQQEIQ